MSNIDIIRAWKDEEYRRSLSEEQRAQLPENPAGLMGELTEVEMEAVAGGKDSEYSQLAFGVQPGFVKPLCTCGYNGCCSYGWLQG